MKKNRWVRFLAAMAIVLGAGAAHADLPEHEVFAADGKQLLLWVSAERGRTEPELHAVERLASLGVETWLLDPLSAYFLPQLPRSMDAVPTPDVVDWLRAALARDKRVAVYAVARAAVPVLRAVAALDPTERARLCVVLMYPNLYTVAEPLAEPTYLDFGGLSGLSVRVLQPRRSAATPWLPGLLESLTGQGATVRHAILENLRERYWMRDTPTAFEVEQSRHMHELLLGELDACGYK